MKRTIKTVIMLSLFVQLSHAQTAMTEETYRVVFDSLVSRLRVMEKDTAGIAGKSFSEVVKFLDGYNLKIIRVMSKYEDNKIPPQNFYGIRLWFTTQEECDYASDYGLTQPAISLYFKDSMPCEKALSLHRKYKGHFTEEVEAFYSDAIISKITEIYIPPYFYMPLVRTRLIERGVIGEEIKTGEEIK